MADRPTSKEHRPYAIASIMQADPHRNRIFKNAQRESRKEPTDNVDQSYSGPVQGVNLMAEENSQLHHTNLFHNVNNHMKTPIFRRGQPFSFIINFKQPFRLANNLLLDLSTGNPKKQDKETSIRLPVSNNPDFQAGKDWAVRLISQTEQSLKLEVRISPNSPIGVWTMVVVTGQEKTPYFVSKYFYILFNPWSKDDTVFMPDESQRYEYVTNQSGIIFTGNYPDVIKKPWLFNQFFPVTLPAAICSLEVSLDQLHKVAYNDPIDVCRALSYAGGYYLLYGNWNGKYSDGVDPRAWISTPPILEKFLEKFQMTRHGQCWVFAAMTCSLSRALGIPCRVITNFVSSHDHTNDLICDTPKAVCDDTDWNFHVWDEAWMARFDLPPGYGGWQAFDSTPQEYTPHDKSQNIYICGPASVDALKKGEVAYPYDAMFIFTESICDRRVNVMNPFINKYLPVKHIQDAFGLLIVTKALGTDQPEDLTSRYRYKKGTSELRQVIDTAAKFAGINVPVITKIEKDEIFCDLLPLESVLIGHPIQIIVKIENRGQRPHTVSIRVGCDSIMYNGALLATVDISRGASQDKLYNRTVDLSPGQHEIIKTELTQEMYLDFVHGSDCFRIHATMTVKESKQAWYGEDNFRLRQPDMILEMPTDIQVGRSFSVRMRFTNPLRLELQKCIFTINADCLSRGIVHQFRNVRPAEDVVHEVQITPEFRGPCRVVALFRSNLLTEITGSKHANCA